MSDINDEYRNAHLTATNGIATSLDKVNFSIIPSISLLYTNELYFQHWGRFIPGDEIKNYVKTIKQQFPEITKISLWASADYLLKYVACAADLTISSGETYYTQQNARQSIVNLFYDGISPVPSIYGSWNNTELRIEVVQKYNDYVLQIAADIKEFIK